MEKARMESKLLSALEHNQSLKTELGAAVTRYEASHLEKAKLELRLQVVLHQNQSLRNELRAAISRNEASHSEKARLELKLQAALEQVRFLKTDLRAFALRQDISSHLGQSQVRNNTATCSSQVARNISQRNFALQIIKEFPKIMEQINQLEIVLSEKENTTIDSKKELVKYETQEDVNVCNNNSVTNGFEEQSLEKQEQAQNGLMQRNVVIRTSEKQIDAQMQSKNADRNKDATITEKQACQIRILNGLMQARKHRTTGELQEEDFTTNKKLKN